MRWDFVPVGKGSVHPLATHHGAAIAWDLIRGVLEIELVIIGELQGNCGLKSGPQHTIAGKNFRKYQFFIQLAN